MHNSRTKSNAERKKRQRAARVCIANLVQKQQQRIAELQKELERAASPEEENIDDRLRCIKDDLWFLDQPYTAPHEIRLSRNVAAHARSELLAGRRISQLSSRELRQVQKGRTLCPAGGKVDAATDMGAFDGETGDRTTEDLDSGDDSSLASGVSGTEAAQEEELLSHLAEAHNDGFDDSFLSISFVAVIYALAFYNIYSCFSDGDLIELCIWAFFLSSDIVWVMHSNTASTHGRGSANVIQEGRHFFTDFAEENSTSPSDSEGSMIQDAQDQVNGFPRLGRWRHGKKQNKKEGFVNPDPVGFGRGGEEQTSYFPGLDDNGGIVVGKFGKVHVFEDSNSREDFLSSSPHEDDHPTKLQRWADVCDFAADVEAEDILAEEIDNFAEEVDKNRIGVDESEKIPSDDVVSCLRAGHSRAGPDDLPIIADKQSDDENLEEKFLVDDIGQSRPCTALGSQFCSESTLRILSKVVQLHADAGPDNSLEKKLYAKPGIWAHQHVAAVLETPWRLHAHDQPDISHKIDVQLGAENFNTSSTEEPVENTIDKPSPCLFDLTLLDTPTGSIDDHSLIPAAPPGIFDFTTKRGFGMKNLLNFEDGDEAAHADGTLQQVDNLDQDGLLGAPLVESRPDAPDDETNKELHAQGFVYRIASYRDAEWVECITADTLRAIVGNVLQHVYSVGNAIAQSKRSAASRDLWVNDAKLWKSRAYEERKILQESRIKDRAMIDYWRTNCDNLVDNAVFNVQDLLGTLGISHTYEELVEGDIDEIFNELGDRCAAIQNMYTAKCEEFESMRKALVFRAGGLQAANEELQMKIGNLQMLNHRLAENLRNVRRESLENKLEMCLDNEGQSEYTEEHFESLNSGEDDPNSNYFGALKDSLSVDGFAEAWHAETMLDHIVDRRQVQSKSHDFLRLVANSEGLEDSEYDLALHNASNEILEIPGNLAGPRKTRRGGKDRKERRARKERKRLEKLDGCAESPSCAPAYRLDSCKPFGQMHSTPSRGSNCAPDAEQLPLQQKRQRKDLEKSCGSAESPSSAPSYYFEPCKPIGQMHSTPHRGSISAPDFEQLKLQQKRQRDVVTSSSSHGKSSSIFPDCTTDECYGENH